MNAFKIQAPVCFVRILIALYTLIARHRTLINSHTQREPSTATATKTKKPIEKKKRAAKAEPHGKIEIV